MAQASNSDSFLYADDSGLIFQHKDVHSMEHQLNKDFANLCEWFLDSKLSIHLGEDKTKCILNRIEIKQYYKLTYLGCLLDKAMSGESKVLKTIKIINVKLKFLYRKNRFLTPELQ